MSVWRVGSSFLGLRRQKSEFPISVQSLEIHLRSIGRRYPFSRAVQKEKEKWNDMIKCENVHLWILIALLNSYNYWFDAEKNENILVWKDMLILFCYWLILISIVCHFLLCIWRSFIWGWTALVQIGTLLFNNVVEDIGLRLFTFALSGYVNDSTKTCVMNVINATSTTKCYSYWACRLTCEQSRFLSFLCSTVRRKNTFGWSPGRKHMILDNL